MQTRIAFWISLSAVTIGCVGDSTITSSDSGSDSSSADASIDVASPQDSALDSSTDAAPTVTYSPSLSDKSKWETFDASQLSFTSGASAVYDGVHVYFVGGPRILQYDVTKPFNDMGAYVAFDATPTGAPALAGAIVVGTLIYFMPSGSASQARWLQYDTTKPFDQLSSWITFQGLVPDAGMYSEVNFIGGAFDGKHLYNAAANQGIATNSAIITSYDTTQPFTQMSSWTSHDMSTLTNGSTYRDTWGHAFDGRYLYMTHLSTSITQFDTSASGLAQSNAYTSFDATQANASYSASASGVFDGTYLYFAPYKSVSASSSIALRYNTTKPFAVTGSWDSIDLDTVDQTNGYVGGQFDGRYVYFAPNGDPSVVPHGHVARYDSTKSFTDKTSWETYDLVAGISAQAKGYFGATFDGRYIYLVPSTTGLLTRFDAKSPSSVPKPTASFF